MLSRKSSDDRGQPLRELTETESAAVDGAVLMAALGKKRIHIGGRPSTEHLFEMARIEPGQRVLDAGCGVGSTAIELASRYDCHVTAVDISPAMIDRAVANVRAAGLEDAVTVEQGDILALDFPDDSFDRVVIEAVVMFVDRPAATGELVRVCKPGGYVVDHEGYFLDGTPDDVLESSQELFPGIVLEDPAAWLTLYRDAGLDDVQYVNGSAEFFGPGPMVRDEGVVGFLKILGRLFSHPSHLRQMAAMAPHVRRLQPHLDYIVIAGRKPT